MTQKAKIFKKSPESKRCGTCLHMKCKRAYVIDCLKHNIQIPDINGNCPQWELGKRGVKKAIMATREQRELKKTGYKPKGD
jgi:hypothetical protein